MGPGVAAECREGKGALHVFDDHFLPEVVDPDTGEPTDGLGELVLTTLTKEALPVVRYRTGDVTRFVAGDLGLGHVVLPQPAMSEAMAFYEGLLGFQHRDSMRLPGMGADGGDAGDRLRDGIYVLRLDGVLMVKRVALGLRRTSFSIRSDNPNYPGWEDVDPALVEIIGRVVWAGRRLG